MYAFWWNDVRAKKQRLRIERVARVRQEMEK
jgi:hypothetical protein